MVQLYESTGGPTWFNQSGWLQGEPCIDGWFGVICCPVSHPWLLSTANGDRCFAPIDAGSRRRLNHVGTMSARRRRLYANLSESVSIVDSSNPSACVTGVITGTAADYATCAVVGLALEGNNLQGTFPSTSSELPSTLSAPSHMGERGLRDLQRIDVRNNALGGPLPAWLATLPLTHVALLGGNNTFTLSGSDAALSHLIKQCEKSGGQCSEAGLPPHSCAAFGSTVVLESGNLYSCQPCGSNTASDDLAKHSALLAVAASAIVLLAMSTLWAQARPRSAALTRWIANITILCTHLQTAGILGSLFTLWPSSLDRAFSCMTLSFTCVSDSACITHYAAKDPTHPIGAALLSAYEAASFNTCIVAAALLVPSLLSPLLRWVFLHSGAMHHPSARLRALVGSIGFAGDIALCILPAALLRACLEQMRSKSGGAVGFIVLTVLVAIAISRTLETLVGFVRRRRREEQSRLRAASSSGTDSVDMTMPRTFTDSFIAWRKEHGLSFAKGRYRWSTDTEGSPRAEEHEQNGSAQPLDELQMLGRTGSVRFKLSPRSEQLPPTLGSCDKATHWGRSVRIPTATLKALGKGRSFKMDGFEGEKGTREGPGRRIERTLPAAKGATSGGSGARTADRQIDDGAGVVPACTIPHPRIGRTSSVRFKLSPRSEQPPPTLGSCDKATHWGRSVRIPTATLKALGKGRSFKMDGFEGEKGTREGPGRQVQARVVKEKAAPPKLGSFGKSGSWGRSVRMASSTLKAMGKQRSFKQDGFAEERTRDRPGRRVEGKLGMARLVALASAPCAEVTSTAVPGRQHPTNTCGGDGDSDALIRSTEPEPRGLAETSDTGKGSIQTPQDAPLDQSATSSGHARAHAITTSSPVSEATCSLASVPSAGASIMPSAVATVATEQVNMPMHPDASPHASLKSLQYEQPVQDEVSSSVHGSAPNVFTAPPSPVASVVLTAPVAAAAAPIDSPTRVISPASTCALTTSTPNPAMSTVGEERPRSEDVQQPDDMNAEAGDPRRRRRRRRLSNQMAPPSPPPSPPEEKATADGSTEQHGAGKQDSVVVAAQHDAESDAAATGDTEKAAAEARKKKKREQLQAHNLAMQQQQKQKQKQHQEQQQLARARKKGSAARSDDQPSTSSATSGAPPLGQARMGRRVINDPSLALPLAQISGCGNPLPQSAVQVPSDLASKYGAAVASTMPSVKPKSNASTAPKAKAVAPKAPAVVAKAKPDRVVVWQRARYSMAESIAYSGDFVTGQHGAHARGYWQLLVWSFQMVLVLLSLSSGQAWNLLATPSPVGVLWLRASGAFVALAIMWAAHVIVEPHAYSYQNVASSWLYFVELTALIAGLFYETMEGDLRDVGIRTAVIEVTTLSLVLVTPMIAACYMAVGLRRSRSNGAYFKTTESDKSARVWEETPVHVGQVPIALSPLRWTAFPLHKESAAITHILPSVPTASHPSRFSPPAAEVYARLHNGRVAERRLASFERAYSRLMVRLLQPSAARELLDAVASQGPHATWRIIDERLNSLLTRLEGLSASSEDATPGVPDVEVGTNRSVMTMEKYRRELEQLFISSSDGGRASASAESPDTMLETNGRSSWPLDANRAEPTSRSLEPQMMRVLRILEEQSEAFVRLGFSVHLCVHLHRDASARSTSAARVFQRWWLTVTDHYPATVSQGKQAMKGKTASGGDGSRDGAARDGPLVPPNVWLGNFRAHGLRLDEPLCSLPSAATLQTVEAMCRQGRGMVYDRFGSVLSLPAGVAAQSLPLRYVGGKPMAVQYELGTGAQRCTPIPSYLLRLLLRDEYSHEPRDRTILDQYHDLVDGLTIRGEASSSKQLCLRLTRRGSISLPSESFDFPRFLCDEAGVARLSVHLCVSDSIHEGMDDELPEPGPARDRHTVCWLTIVDLAVRRPCGRYSLPERAPRARERLVVPAEIMEYDPLWVDDDADSEEDVALRA